MSQGAVQELVRVNPGNGNEPTFGLWRSGLRHRLPGIDVMSTRQDLHGQLSAFEFSGARLWSLRSSTQRIFRTSSDTQRRFAPMAILVMEGRAKLTHLGRHCDLLPGAFVFIDSAEPLELEYLDNFHHLYMQFARTTFTPALFRESVALPNAALSPLDQTFFDCVKHLWESGPLLDPLKHSTALAAVISLASLTTAFDRQRRARCVPVRVSKAMAYIEHNLGEAWLTPKAVADAQKVSRRYLDDLFATSGYRIESWIWERRLQRAAEELSVSNQLWGAGKKTILQIALDLGFRSPSHFSRTFTKRFGVCPRERRRLLSPDS
jgi:AraC family transcriptional regulator, positive regulator of tynA and feaB